MEEQNSLIKKSVTIKIRTLMLACALIVGLAAAGLLVWQMNRQPLSLLPEDVAKKMTQFTPFFFFDKIPGNYSLDKNSIGFDQGIAIIPLTHPDGPTIAITEQLLPADLSPDLLRQDTSQEVRDTAAPAIINNIEGRLVGIMTSKEHKLLLIINAPGDMSNEAMSELLQRLKPIR